MKFDLDTFLEEAFVFVVVMFATLATCFFVGAK